MIDTVHGASASAIIYSISETAKANGLKPYEYFEYLLTGIPKHQDICQGTCGLAFTLHTTVWERKE